MNLARHGFVNPDSVRAIGNDVGYRNVGYDLMALVALFRGAVSRIKDRTATQVTDWEQADVVAARLLDLTAIRETRHERQPKLADTRLRALTLMVRAYEHARRAVRFLRYEHGDAERVAPSVYTAKGRGKKPEQVRVPPVAPGPESSGVDLGDAVAASAHVIAEGRQFAPEA